MRINSCILAVSQHPDPSQPNQSDHDVYNDPGGSGRSQSLYAMDITQDSGLTSLPKSPEAA